MFDKILNFLSGQAKTIAIIIGVLVVLSIIFIILYKDSVQSLFDKLKTTFGMSKSETSVVGESNKGEPNPDTTHVEVPEVVQLNQVNQETKIVGLDVTDDKSLRIGSVKDITVSETIRDMINVQSDTYNDTSTLSSVSTLVEVKQPVKPQSPTPVVLPTPSKTPTIASNIAQQSSAALRDAVTVVQNSVKMISGNSASLYTGLNYTGEKVEVPLYSEEILWAPDAKWQFKSIKTNGNTYVLRLSGDDLKSKNIMFVLAREDIPDISAAISQIPARNTYSGLLNANGNIFAEILTYEDAIVETEDLSRGCIETPPASSLICREYNLY